MITYEDMECKSIGIIVHDNQGRLVISRMGDIEEDGSISPFFVNKEFPPIFNNRNQIYWKDGPTEEGLVGIWNWTAVPRTNDSEKDYVEAHYSANEQPIEVYELSSVNTEKALVKKLVEGIQFKPCCQKVVFCFATSNRYYSGVLCEVSSLETYSNELKLSKDVIALPLCDFTKDDLFSYKSLKFIKYIGKTFSSKKYFVKSLFDIVKEAILRRSSWNVLKARGLTRNDWRKLKDFLTEISDDSLYADIAMDCDCSEDEAKMYVEKFISVSKEHIMREDIDIKVLEEIVEANDQLWKAAEEIAYRKWEDEHKETIQKKNQELKAIQEKLNYTEDELNRVLRSIKEANEELALKEEELKEKQALGEEVVKSINDKIENARENVSDFISTFTILGTSNNISSQQNDIQVSAEYITGEIKCNGESADWEDLLESVEDELSEAGVSGKYTHSLSAFLYSTYLNNCPVMCLGPNGENVAHAFSIGCFGKYAGIVDCVGKYSKSVIDDLLSGDDHVVIVKNPFSAEWFSRIPDLLSNHKKFFILVAPFTEDVLIEPKSLFTYALPLITELFVEQAPRGNFVGQKPSWNFVPFEREKTSPIQDNVFNLLGMGLLLKRNYQSILSDMHSMNQQFTAFEDYFFSIIPYSYVTNQGALIWEKILAEKEINKEFKDSIKRFLGIEE